MYIKTHGYRSHTAKESRIITYVRSENTMTNLNMLHLTMLLVNTPTKNNLISLICLSDWSL